MLESENSFYFIIKNQLIFHKRTKLITKYYGNQRCLSLPIIMKMPSPLAAKSLGGFSFSLEFRFYLLCWGDPKELVTSLIPMTYLLWLLTLSTLFLFNHLFFKIVRKKKSFQEKKNLLLFIANEMKVMLEFSSGPTTLYERSQVLTCFVTTLSHLYWIWTPTANSY